MTYAEYLTSLGASADEVKVLDTAIGRKAFDDQQTKLAEAERLRGIAVADEKKIRDWWQNTANPEFTTMQRAKVAAEAELAKAKTALLSAQEEGLTELAKQLGWAPESGNGSSAGGNDGSGGNGSGGDGVFDPKKYNLVTEDTLTAAAESLGERLAMLEDMVAEHKELFPNIKLNVAALRREAVAAHKPIDQFWSEKYNVSAARTAAETAAKAADEKRIRDDERKKVETEMASRYGDPNVRPLVESRHPFTTRTETGRDKMPWDNDARPADRVARATKSLIEGQVRTN